MNERERAERFNRELENILAGEDYSSAQLTSEDREALELARLFAQMDFSAAPQREHLLRQQLVNKAAQEYKRLEKRQRVSLHLSQFTQTLAWVGMALVLVVTLSWVFKSTLGIPPAPTPTPTQTATPAPPTPTTPVITPTSSPTVQPSESPIEPFLTSAGIRELSWSLDGRFLVFKSQTSEEIATSPGGEGYMPLPPGTIHFVDVKTGETCQYLMENDSELSLSQLRAWLPDSRFLTLADDGSLVILDTPCQEGSASPAPGAPQQTSELYAVSQDNLYFLLGGETECWLYDLQNEKSHQLQRCSPDATFSPDQRLLGITIDSQPDYATDIIRVTTGELVSTIPWKFSAGGLGSLPGPNWLNEQVFLLQRTDEGPLLVTLGEMPQVQPIAPTFFNLPGANHQYGIGMGDNNGFHILLHDLGPEYTQSRIWLYHAESRAVEELPYTQAKFSADGNWLTLLNTVFVDNRESFEHLLRLIDPPGNQARLFADSNDQLFPGISPDGQWVAVASQPQSGSTVTITVRPVSAGETIDIWTIGSYSLTFTWSPDSHYLAVNGYSTLGNEQALFILPAHSYTLPESISSDGY